MKKILEDIMLRNGNDDYTYTIFNEHNNKYGHIFVAIPYNSEGLVINSPTLYYKLTKPIEEFTITDKEECVYYCTSKYDADDFSIRDAFMQGDFIEPVNVGEL
jgi:hypothetical protein